MLTFESKAREKTGVPSPVDTSPVGAVDLTAFHPVSQDGAAIVVWLIPDDQHTVGCDVINLWLFRSLRRF